VGKPQVGERERPRHDMRQITLNSAPVIVLEKAIYTNLGRTKALSLGGLKMAESKLAADAIMSSLDNDERPRYARVEKSTQSLNPGKKTFPHIEVLELEGHTLLGVPGSSRVKQYASFSDRGKRKQLVIAVHDGKPVFFSNFLRKKLLPALEKESVHQRKSGGESHRGLSKEAEAAVMRSGVNGLAKQVRILIFLCIQSLHVQI
jgi:hypothetical protein